MTSEGKHISTNVCRKSYVFSIALILGFLDKRELCEMIEYFVSVFDNYKSLFLAVKGVINSFLSLAVQPCFLKNQLINQSIIIHNVKGSVLR